MTAVHSDFDQLASDALWTAVAWCDGLGLSDDDPRAEQTPRSTTRTWANWIPVGLDKSPLVREWRHLSAQGIRSPRVGLGNDWTAPVPGLTIQIWRSRSPNPPAAYALLTGSAGLVVVDVDDPSLLPALLSLYGDTPVRTETPSGGVHLYYLAPPDDSVEAEAVGGVAHVTSRTGVRGPRTYDVKAAGGMVHLPGGESHKGRYTTPLPARWWEPGELRAMLPTFPVDAYERDWQHHHPDAADWSPRGDRADGFFVTADAAVLLPSGEPGTAADLWADAAETIGPAVEGERHDKARRLALWLGDRGCEYAAALERVRDWNRGNAPPATDEEIERWCRDAYKRRRSAEGYAVRLADDGGDEEWPEPETPEEEMPEEDFAAASPAPALAPQPVETSYALPDLDVDRLFAGVPGAAAWFKVAARHEVLNVRPDALAGFGLALASAAIAGRARLKIADMQTPAYLFALGEATTSRGKSLGLELAGFDVLLSHSAKINAPLDERATLLLKRKRERLASQIKARKAAADRAKGAEADRLDGEVVDLELELKGLEQRLYLYIGGQDSPEGFFGRVQDCGYALLVSPEAAGVLRKFAASDSGFDKLDVLLSGHSEDPVSVALKGDWSDASKREVFRARCGVILAAQPTVLTPKTREESVLFTSLADRGFFRRFLTFRPRRYKAGERPAPSTAEERAPLRAAWEARLRGLIEPIEGQDHPLVPSKPVIVGCSAQAAALFAAFDDEMRDAAEGGDLSGAFLESFAGGAAQQAKRVALVLRLLRLGRVAPCDVDVDDARRAIDFVRGYQLPHMVALSQRAVFSPVDDDLEVLVMKLRERGGAATRVDLLRGKNSLGRAWGLAEQGRTARIDRVAQQGVLYGRLTRTGDGKRGLPITYKLVA